MASNAREASRLGPEAALSAYPAPTPRCFGSNLHCLDSAQVRIHAVDADTASRFELRAPVACLCHVAICAGEAYHRRCRVSDGQEITDLRVIEVVRVLCWPLIMRR